MNTKFHVSLPCRHISATRKYYEGILGASVGRNTANWLDIDLFGHQITFAKCGSFRFDYPNYSFEKTVLPSFHFGIILEPEDWAKMKSRLGQGEDFYIPETLFLMGKSGEHNSFFVRDPNGYVIEFKKFSVAEEIFKS